MLRNFLLTILLCAALLLPVSAANAAGGVSFLDDEPLTVVLPEGSPAAAFQVTVFNAGEAAVDVTLDVYGLADPDGSAAPDGLIAPLPARLEVPPRTAASFALTLNRPASGALEYSGRFILTASDGSLAAKPAVFKLAAASDADALDPRLTSALTLQAVYPGFSPAAWQIGAFRKVSIPLAAGFHGADRLAGQLAGPGGDLAEVWRRGGQLEIDSVSGAGAYSGKADLRPLQPGTAAVTLTLQVRDGLLMPLLVLAAGLLLAYGLDTFFRTVLPAKRLELKLQKAVETAREKQTQALDAKKKLLEQLKGCLSADWIAENGKDGFRIASEAGGEGLLLDRTCAAILAEFRSAPSDELRSKWGPDGSEAEKALGYIDSLEGLNALAEAALKEIQDLCGVEMFVKKAPAGPLQVPLIKTALAGLAPRRFSSASELQSAQEGLKSALALLQDYRVTFTRIASRIAAAGAAPDPALGRILDQLVSPLMAGQPDLELQKEIFAQIEIEKGKEKYKAMGGRMEVEPGAAFGLGQPAPAAYLIRALPFLRPAHPLAEKPSAELRRELRRAELLYWLISGAAVLLAGMQTLYFANPIFGAWADYLGVLLWGVVVNEGVRLGRSIVPKLTRFAKEA